MIALSVLKRAFLMIFIVLFGLQLDKMFEIFCKTPSAECSQAICTHVWLTDRSAEHPC